MLATAPPVAGGAADHRCLPRTCRLSRRTGRCGGRNTMPRSRRRDASLSPQCRRAASASRPAFPRPPHARRAANTRGRSPCPAQSPIPCGAQCQSCRGRGASRGYQPPLEPHASRRFQLKRSIPNQPFLRSGTASLPAARRMTQAAGRPPWSIWTVLGRRGHVSEAYACDGRNGRDESGQRHARTRTPPTRAERRTEKCSFSSGSHASDWAPQANKWCGGNARTELVGSQF